MAVRQVDVALVPLGTEVSYGEDGYEVKGFGSEIALTAQKKLEEHLGEPKQFLRGWYVYGDEKKSRVDVHYEDSGVEIHARIDASDPLPMIKLLCQISFKLCCRIFVVESKQIFETSVVDLLNSVSNSRAASFLANPDLFLKNLARES